MADKRITNVTEAIASLALNTFDGLPTRCKPRALHNGQSEWTPMSAIILSRSSVPVLETDFDSGQMTSSSQAEVLKIVSLATGSKSLPISALPKCNGLVLHDCHAEILALRGLNRWFLEEMERTLQDMRSESDWLVLQDQGEDQGFSRLPFRLREGVEISLFSTEAPCGDASMELLMAEMVAAGGDVTPWTTDAISNPNSGMGEGRLPSGRGDFANLGALRRKPARADAEISMSQSCTDKLMLKQFLSILNFPTDLLIEKSEEAFLKRLVVYEDQYHEIGYQRAFSIQGRLNHVLPVIGAVHMNAVKFFSVERLSQDFRIFEYKKCKPSSQRMDKTKVTNISAVWIAADKKGGNSNVVEVLINGVKQGFKQFDARKGKGSVLCRENIIQKTFRIGDLLQRRGQSVPWLGFDDNTCSTYARLKSLPGRQARGQLKRIVLDSIGGWPQKSVEDDFRIVISRYPDESRFYTSCFSCFHYCQNQILLHPSNVCTFNLRRCIANDSYVIRIPRGLRWSLLGR